jgi:hypothetical protein
MRVEKVSRKKRKTALLKNKGTHLDKSINALLPPIQAGSISVPPQPRQAPDKYTANTVPQPGQVPNTYTDKRQLRSRLRNALYQLAKLWMQILIGLSGTICSAIFLTAVGLNSWGPAPLVDAAQQHPTMFIVAGFVLVFISFLAWFLSHGPDPNTSNAKQQTSQLDWRLISATGTSTISSISFFFLLSLVLLRPTWCPTLLCPAPKLILQSINVHDDNLEVYFQTIQSASHLLSGNPANYTIDTLPRGTDALRIDTSNQKPYRVVVGIHSLQRGRFGLIIEQVVLLAKKVTLNPYPLRVWTESEPRSFDSNLYQVTYRGQESGSHLLATYTPLSGIRGGNVQLLPGESDELDIQITSKAIADIQFQVQVTYRIINDSQEHHITLPNLFEVIFSSTSNWFPYYFQDGHLIANLQ